MGYITDTKFGMTREHKYTKKRRQPPSPSPIGGVRVGYGSRACIDCKIWLEHSEVARGVRDSEDISPVVGKRHPLYLHISSLTKRKGGVVIFSHHQFAANHHSSLLTTRVRC